VNAKEGNKYSKTGLKGLVSGERPNRMRNGCVEALGKGGPDKEERLA